MDRRDFIQAGAAVALGSVLAPGAITAATSPSPRPTRGQSTWQDCELGIIYHFDLPVAANDFSPNNSSRQVFNPDLYQPKKLDTDQWLQAAKACGARYAIFTATHFSGFMQWQSDLYPYGLKQTSWRNGKADVVADFVQSCHRAGIRPGLYFSVHRNVYHQLWDYYVDWGKSRGTPAQEKFNRTAEGMMKELCSRYGPLVQIWLDAGTKTPKAGGPDLLPVFERYQPNSVFYSSLQRADHRWIGNEEGHAGYPCWATMPSSDGLVSHNAPEWKKRLANGDPNGSVWSPGMVDVPLRGANRVHNWFWAPNQDHAAHSRDRLVEMYLSSVGRNCNFVIGEVITPEGLVPEPDIQRLAEFGREKDRRFGQPIATTAGRGNTVTLTLNQPTRIGALSIMEEINQGERVRRYQVAAEMPSGRWEPLCDGQSIGHKRIQTFAPVEVNRVRLQLLESTARPQIREVAVYAV